MVRIRHGWLVVTLGLALSLGATACKKDEKKSDPAAGDKSAEKTGDKAAGDKMAEKPAPTGGATASGDDLSLLPLDSELVLGINLAQVQQSALWKQFVEPKLMTGDTVQKLTEFKTKCGFDPMASTKSISLGFRALASEKPDGVMVVHGVDKAKLWPCFEAMKAEMAKDGSEFTLEGDVGIIKSSKGPAIAMTFVNDSTAVAVIGDKANAAGAKAAAAGGSTLKTSAPFLEMYGKVKSTDSVWGLMNGNSPVFEKMGSMGVKPKAMFGSLNVTDGLSLDLRVRLDSPDAAAQVTTMGKSQMQQAAAMFDKIDLTSEGSDVKLTVVLSNQKLQALIAQFAGMMGAFGGMGAQ